MAEEEQRSWDMLSEDRKKEVKVNRQPTPRGGSDAFSAFSALIPLGLQREKKLSKMNDDYSIGHTKHPGLPGQKICP